MKKSQGLPKSVYAFLRQLEKNNARPWFNENKTRYIAEHEKTLAFVDRLLSEMSLHDELVPMSPKQSMFRIYRDVRFSKDKRPYKNHFSGRLKRATKWKRGGYYYHFEPGNTFLAGGFWNPNSEDLKHIRSQIAADAGPLHQVLKSASFKRLFGSLRGEQVKTAPKGYGRDHPEIDLLRHKQFLVYRSFRNTEVHETSFLGEMVKTFRGMRSFFDCMSEMLTTDLNGTPIE